MFPLILGGFRVLLGVFWALSCVIGTFCGTFGFWVFRGVSGLYCWGFWVLVN